MSLSDPPKLILMRSTTMTIMPPYSQYSFSIFFTCLLFDNQSYFLICWNFPPQRECTIQNR
jgi:hypothetical protein